MLHKDKIKLWGKPKYRHWLFLLPLLFGLGFCQTSPKKDIKTSETTPLEVMGKKSSAPIPTNEETTQNTDNTAGTFMDTRDGQTYPWVRLKDDKKWMAQNLNYNTKGSWCFDDKADNCSNYGRLYTWQSANESCPKGWRLPTDDEWWAMASHYGKAYNSYAGQEKVEGKDDGELAYQALIQKGTTGFNALFGGSHAIDEGFDYLGDLGCYWSSSANSTSNALGYYFYIHSKGLARDSYQKATGFSCRCVQD